MAELTPEEKQKIYEEERFRLESQQKLIKATQKKKSSSNKIGCLAGIILILLVVVYISVMEKSPSPSTTSVVQKSAEIADTATKAKIESLVQESIKTGLIKKMDTQQGKAWIQEDVWLSIDSQLKENITKNLALYFSIQKNQEYRNAEIIGWISGKKMASYTSLGGFKVY